MSSIWQLPEVRSAAVTILAEWKAVRGQRPDWPPMQSLREAKRRHAAEIALALNAIDGARALTMQLPPRIHEAH